MIAGPAGTALCVRELGPECDEEWDRLAGEQLESGFMQSSAWAEFKRREGYETVRLGLFGDEGLIGGASFIRYPGPPGGGFAVCPEGPALQWDEPAVARECLRRLAEAVPERWTDCVGLRIEP